MGFPLREVTIMTEAGLQSTGHSGTGLQIRQTPVAVTKGSCC